MREWLDRLSIKAGEFMQGRYGSDSLNKTLLIIAIVTIFVQFLFPYASVVTWILLILCIFRSLSTNTEKRAKENETFLKIISGPKRFFKRLSLKWKNRKTTVYFKCSGCGAHLSLPKGKGKLRVICPKCGKEIFKNT